MKFDKKKSKFKLILTTFCCLVWLSCFCSANWTWTISWTYSISMTWSSSMYSSYINVSPSKLMFINTTPSSQFLFFDCSFSNISYSSLDFYNLVNSSYMSIGFAYYYPTTRTWNPTPYYTTSSNNSTSLWLRNAWASDYRISNALSWDIWKWRITVSPWRMYFSVWVLPFNSINLWTVDCISSSCSLSFDYNCSYSYQWSTAWVVLQTWYSLINYDLDNWFSMDNPSCPSCPTCPTIDQNYCVSNNLCPSCPICPSQYTSLECQQEYSLIPVSSVDQNYCVSNNLCPASEGGECSSWDVSWSALYINNVQHLWGAIIRVDIPEEISRDYEQWIGEFDLDVVWYNVNYEAIQDKIDLQNYKPSQEDFNNVIWVLAKYMPLIVILIWFVVIVAIIKNSFKSKKL